MTVADRAVSAFREIRKRRNIPIRGFFLYTAPLFDCSI